MDDAPAEEIIVTGIRASIAEALSTKRASDVISDSISAQDIGKLPDQNVSETLSRIPGVQITRVEGEGAKINVRGIDLNRTQINGRNFIGASNNGDPNLSDFPSEILASVDIIKSPSADLVEGWLGAIINLKTRRPLDLRKRLLSGRLQGSYADGADKFGGKASASYAESFLDGTLGLLVSGTVSDFEGRADGFTNRGFTRLTGPALAATGVSAPFGFRPNRFESFLNEYATRRYGINGTLQYRPIDELTFTVDGFKSHSDTERDRYVSQFIFTNALSNARVLEDGTLDRGTFTGVTARPLISDGPSTNDTDALSANIEYATDRLAINLNASTSRGDSDGGNDAISQDAIAYPGNDFIPVFRQIAGNTVAVAYDNNGLRSVPDHTISTNYDRLDPSQYEAFTIVDQAYPTRNRGKDADIDARYEVDLGPLSAIKVGARIEEIGVFRAVNVTTYTAAQLAAGDPTPGTTLRATEVAGIGQNGTRNDLLAGVGGTFPRGVIVGDFDVKAFRERFNGVVTPDALARRQASVFDVDQTTKAFFIKAEFATELAGLDISGNVGVRQVNTRRTSSGFDQTGITTTVARSETSKFNDTLPSFNLAAKPNEDIAFRFAAAKVTARPQLSLTGIGITFQPTTSTGSAGNPFLKPFSATQYDLSAEWYFAPASLVSLALFKKDIAAFTRTVQTIEDHPEVQAPGLTNTLYVISRPSNGTDGSVKGFEANYFHALTFLPAPFDGLGVNLSYTYSDGETPNVDELSGETLSLPNLSKQSYNLIGYYEKYGLNVRVAYNYRSSFLLSQQPASLGGSLYQAGRGQVDASVSYQVNDWLQLTLDGINLNRDVRSLYTGTKNRLTTLWQDDRRFYFGVTAKF